MAKLITQDFISVEFCCELNKDIKSKRSEIAEMLTTGSGVNDYTDYSHWTGYVKALDEVISMMEKVYKRVLNK
jgi:hypothetical protein